jgi:uncharacterized protein
MDYKGLRRETPWLRRLPSEYFYQHVRVTTQPLEAAPSRERMAALLEAMDAEGVLCFASDYPHWDTDEVAQVAGTIPAAWHEKVFRRNAIELFGWDDLA